MKRIFSISIALFLLITTAKIQAVCVSPVNPNFSAAPVCFGQTTQFFDISSNTGAQLAYSWDFNGDATFDDFTIGNPAFNFASPGSFNATLRIYDTAFSCFKDTVILVTVNALPIVSVATVNPNVCAGDSLTLNGAGAVGFSWSGGITNGVKFLPVATTVYTVFGADANGCFDDDTIRIKVNTLPVISANASNHTGCLNSSTTLLSAGGLTYSWVPSTGLLIDTGSVLTAKILGSIIYTVTGTDINGCKSKDTVTISSLSLPAKLNITADGATTLCPGGSVKLITTISNGYSWVPSGLNNDSLTVTSSGIYSVYAVDGNNCKSDSASNTITVNISSNSTLTVNVKINGAPALNSTVRVYKVKHYYTSFPTVNSGVVDANGRIRFLGMPLDTFIISASPDLATSPTAITTFSGNKADWFVSSSLRNVCLSSDTINIDLITLAAQTGAGAVGGTVLDVSDTTAQRKPGEPIKGVGVIIQRRPGGNIVARSVTGTSGDYQFNNLDTGKYDIFVQMPGFEMLKTYSLNVTNSNKIFVDKNFFVDSVEGYVDTTSRIIFTTCLFVPNFNNTIVCKGIATNFNDLSVGMTMANTSYKWDFTNDGIVDDTTKGNVTFKYPNSGTFTAKLILKDRVAGCSDSVLHSITVKSSAIAKFGFGPACTGALTNLLDSSLASGTTGNQYSWDFANDGTIESNFAGSINMLTSAPGSISVRLTIKDTISGCLSSVLKTTTVKDPMRVVASPLDTTVCQGIPLKLKVSGGVSYVWKSNAYLTDSTSNNPTIKTIMYFAKTKFAVTGTDINGCKSNDTARVTVKQGPKANIAIFSTVSPSLATISAVCQGTPISIIDSSVVPTSTKYSWDYDNNGIIDDTTKGNVSIKFASFGNKVIKLKLVALNGCTDSIVRNMTVNPNLFDVNAGIDQTIICGQKVLLTASTPPQFNQTITYSWSPPSETSNPFIKATYVNPDTTTTFIIAALYVSSGCMDYDTIKVAVTPLKVQGGSDKTIECGNSVQLQGNINNSVGTSIQWYPGNALSTQTSLLTTANPPVTVTYTVVATNNTCISSDTVTVNITPYSVSAGSDINLICGNSATLNSSVVFTSGGNAPTATYNWSPSQGLNSISSTNPTVNATDTTVYTLTVNRGLCSIKDSVLVSVKPYSVFAGQDAVITCGSTLALSGTVGSNVTAVSYAWSPNNGISNSQIATPVCSAEKTTTYALTVTKGLCKTTDSIKVTVQPFAVSAGQDITIDCGSEATIQGSTLAPSGATTIWTPSTNLIDPTKRTPITRTGSPITYVLTVTKGTCVNSDTMKVGINSDIPLAFAANKQVFSNLPAPYLVNFTNNTPNTIINVNWTWNFGDSIGKSNLKGPVTYPYPKAGTYNVSLIAKSQYGTCGDTLLVKNYIIAFTPNAVRSIIAEDADVVIHPNPTSGIFSIDISNWNINDVKVEVMDITGKLISTSNYNMNKSGIRISVSLDETPSGIYFVKLSSGNEQVLKKVVKN